MQGQAHLHGRHTYDEFASAWPTRTGPFADKLNSDPKLEAAEALARLAEESGLSLIEMAIAFVLEHPAIQTARRGVPRATRVHSGPQLHGPAGMVLVSKPRSEGRRGRQVRTATDAGRHSSRPIADGSLRSADLRDESWMRHLLRVLHREQMAFAVMAPGGAIADRH